MPIDIHDYFDVAEQYDRYVENLAGGIGADALDFYLDLAPAIW